MHFANYKHFAALHCSLDISQAMLKADNEDKQDGIMLVKAEHQENPDDEQLNIQQDNGNEDGMDNGEEELNYDAKDGDDGENNAVQQDDNDDDDALSKTLLHELIIAHTKQLL